MRRLLALIGLILVLVGCTAPPAQGGAGTGSPPAASPSAYDDGY
jgi:hypothetical protein